MRALRTTVSGVSRLCLLGVVLVLSACPPAIRRPESAQLSLSGTIVAGGWARRGEPVPDATVSVRRADTGELLADNTTSSAGGYRLATTVSPGTRIIVVARANGFAPAVNAFTVGPYTELTWGAALSPLETWECTDSSCTAPLVDLDWQSPPSGASGTATAFDGEPPLLVDVDDARPALLALGFATLGGPGGSLALRVPLTQWTALTDAMPGNGTLEVPAATFDVTTAKWSRLTPVPLVTEAGLPIPESALGALQRLEFSGGATAQFPAQGDVFLAVLGAATASGCVTGALRAEGQAAVGVTLGFKGFEPVASTESGRFCMKAPISAEVAAVRGQYAGLPYSLGSLRRAAIEGTCGAGSCTDLGGVEVLPGALQVSSLCKFSGKVIDSLGAPIESAEVVALDQSLTGAAVDAFCGPSGARCRRTAASGADGTFSLTAPLQSTMFIGARAITTTPGAESERSTSQTFETCPTEPLTLKLSRGTSRLEVTATFGGAELSWSPPRAASHLVVTDAAGLPKWELVSAVGLTPPLTFGTVPPGATAVVSASGSPVSGDEFIVELSGVGRDGITYVGVGTATRP